MDVLLEVIPCSTRNPVMGLLSVSSQECLEGKNLKGMNVRMVEILSSYPFIVRIGMGSHDM